MAALSTAAAAVTAAVAASASQYGSEKNAFQKIKLNSPETLIIFTSPKFEQILATFSERRAGEGEGEESGCRFTKRGQ